jgi:hypothetical protein
MISMVAIGAGIAGIVIAAASVSNKKVLVFTKPITSTALLKRMFRSINVNPSQCIMYFSFREENFDSLSQVDPYDKRQKICNIE